jgi:transcriptional regulator with XRE-family HTH domain
MEKDLNIIEFLESLIQKRDLQPNQLADDVGVSQATIRRWQDGKAVPNIHSCCLLSHYSGIPVLKILAASGRLVGTKDSTLADWPDLRDYVIKGSPLEIEKDIITMMMDLVEGRRKRNHETVNIAKAVKHE